MKFTKKPVTIEAWQNYSGDPEIDGGPLRAVPSPEWFGEACRSGAVVPGPNGSLLINTLEGQMRADIGDWIIKGVKGELYPCKPDVFAATYDRAPETFMDRLVIEHAELTARIGLLSMFLTGPVFASLDTTARGLLTAQLSVMVAYRDILTLRIG